MTVSRIYRELLIQDIIRESLRRGEVLTKGEIDAELERVTKSNPDLSEPFTQRSLYNIEELEDLSSSKINKINQCMINDLSVAYSAMTEQAKEVTAAYDSVNSELKAIEKRIRALEESTSNLLIVAKNVEGFFDYVSDRFVDQDKIDVLKSDIFVDNKVGVVTLEAESSSRISMPVIESDLQFNVITRDQLQAITLAPNSVITDAFTDQENAWIQRVEMARGVGAVTASLIVRMPNSAAEISKIVYKTGVSDEGNISTVTVQYSDDGLNWFNVDGNGTARLIGDVTLMFSPVAAGFWKFVYNKAGYDEFRGDRYIYEFGARSIQMYGVEYKLKSNKLTGTLISQALEADKEFNKVSMRVCETLPSGTNINYSLAALTATELADYLAGTLLISNVNFNKIDPLDREDPVNPVSLDFAKIDDLTGVSSEYDKDGALTFRYQNDFNVLIDYTVPSNIARDELKVLRNVGDNSQDSGGGPVQVNLTDHGWAFDGTYYSCEIYVSEDSGRVIDFGEESLEIDNFSTSGQVTLAKGFHKVKTHKKNWRGIDPTAITTTDNPDVLYPYNHKYLIEGIGTTLYSDDMTALVSSVSKNDIVDPDGLYTGVARYWEKTLEELTIFDFTQNVDNDNYNVFAFVKDLAGTDRIMIKESPEPGLLTSEKLAIITRAISGDLHKGIILKAELSSEDSKVTPVLDEYIIRLGL
jgi:hypothetical protein